jgi:hypothetical protein
MPVATAIAAVGATIGASAAAGGFAFASLATYAGAIATSALSFASSKLLAQKQNTTNGALSGGVTKQIQQAITSHRVVYGKQRVSGPVVLAESTNKDSTVKHKILHLVIALAAHEVDRIGTVYLDDYAIPDDFLRPNGEVKTGNFKDGAVFIKKYLGTTPQTADPDLLDAIDRLDSNFQGNGIAYVYVKFKYSAGLFPNGIPNISAEVYGKKLYDPRDGQTRWSDNPALVIRDYLTNNTYGRRAAVAEIDDTNFGEIADLCEEYFETKEKAVVVSEVDAESDEFRLQGDVCIFQTADRVRVTASTTFPTGLAADTDYYVILQNERKTADKKPTIKLANDYNNALSGTAIDISSSGAGTITVTKNAEPRYSLNGVVETERTPIDVIEEMLSTFGGKLVHQGGFWRLYGGSYIAPTVSLNEDNLAGPVSVQTRQPSRERFNAVKGNYVTPEYYGQATSYPNITNTTYQTQDGGIRVFGNLDLPMVSRSNQAQRLATFALNKHRQQITVSLECNLSAMQAQVGEMLQFSFARYGWVDKVFEVVEWSLQNQENAFKVSLTLREFASTVYDFTSSTDETETGDQPEITVPDGTPGDGPTGVVITSGTDELYVNQDGTVVSRIKVVWDIDDDNLISRYELQYKRSSDSVYEPSQFVAFDTNLLYIWDVEDGQTYDVRIRSVSPLGIVSDWVDATPHTVIGKTARPENVSGFSAQQNGNVVLFKWEQVPDKDVAGYEIRFLEVT